MVKEKKSSERKCGIFAQPSLLGKLKNSNRALKILHNDFDSVYKTRRDKSGKYAIEVKQLRILGLEIFKTLNKLNPAFIEERLHRTK